MSRDAAGIVVIMAAYSYVVINSIIYMSCYSVVKSSLLKWMRETAAKLTNQQPPTT